MVEPGARQVGLRGVLLIAGAVVAGVLFVSVATGFLPAPVRDLLFRTPLPIVLLIAGTVLVLWRIARTGRGDRA